MNLAHEPAVHHYNARMATLLAALLPWRDDPEAVATPAPLTLTAPAKPLWELFHDNVEAQLGKSGGWRLFVALGIKRPNTPRTAAIVTLVENPDATTLGSSGSRPALR